MSNKTLVICVGIKACFLIPFLKKMQVCYVHLRYDPSNQDWDLEKFKKTLQNASKNSCDCQKSLVVVTGLKNFEETQDLLESVDLGPEKIIPILDGTKQSPEQAINEFQFEEYKIAM